MIIHLGFTIFEPQKYIARNDIFLMYIPIIHLNASKPSSPRRTLCSVLYAFPINSVPYVKRNYLQPFKEFRKISKVLSNLAKVIMFTV